MRKHCNGEGGRGGQMVVSDHVYPPVPAPLRVLLAAPGEHGTGKLQGADRQAISLPLTAVLLNAQMHPGSPNTHLCCSVTPYLLSTKQPPSNKHVSKNPTRVTIKAPENLKFIVNVVLHTPAHQ